MSRPIDADAVKGLIRSGISVDTCADQDYVCELVDDIPTIDAVSEWIPCSERLPSENGMYLVTSREKATAEEFGFDLDDVEVKKMRFDEDGWRIPKHIPEWINGVVHTTVLAWMPLPKPYGEREGER